jgi:hypothetical protein
MAMVERTMDFLFDFGEIADHTIGVQLLRTAINHDYPVMTVDIRAFTFIRELQTMGA